MAWYSMQQGNASCHPTGINVQGLWAMSMANLGNTGRQGQEREVNTPANHTKEESVAVPRLATP